MYKLAFEFNKRIKAATPSAIDESLRNDLLGDIYYTFIRYNTDIPHPRPDIYAFRNMFENDTLNVVEGLPRPTKRISAIMRTLGIKLRPANITSIGNWLNTASSAAVSCELVITDHVTGNPEDYGHDRSCWWTDFWEARDVLVYNKGGAILAYNGDTLLGRAWHCPDEYGNMVIFNPYGMQSAFTWAKLVSAAIPGTQARYTTWNEGQDDEEDEDGYISDNEVSGLVYFNNQSNIGYVFNPLNDSHKSSIPEFWNLPTRSYEWKYERFYECRGCGKRRSKSELDKYGGLCEKCGSGGEAENAARIRCTCCGVYLEPEDAQFLTSGEAHCPNCYSGCAVHTEQGEVYPRGWRPQE